jgi:alpha-glucan phosphorylase-like protein
LIDKYFSQIWPKLNLSRDQFVDLGKQAQTWGETFVMPVLALKLSEHMNSVSELHGNVSRKMWNWLWPDKSENEVPITHITNGIHTGTWIARQTNLLFQKYLAPDWMDRADDPEIWENIERIPDYELWAVRKHLKRKLTVYCNEVARQKWQQGRFHPVQVVASGVLMEPYSLTIGFARRFATYKRAHLLFTNIEKLAAILDNEDYPVQIIFAGKAHPADKAGQDLIKKIIEISKSPEFIGKIFFIENYDMEVARRLVRGVDIWLNTPTRPLEASGTSGEKAVMNGVLNLSVLDGWWAEGYKQDAGWGLREARTYGNQQFQDELDAETIYNLLEDEIIPMFYNRSKGIPVKWVGFIKNCISEIAPHFTMKRMLDDYQSKYYDKLINRSRQIKADHFKLAHEIDAWKTKIRAGWHHLEVKRIAVPDPSKRTLALGDEFVAELELKLNGIKASDLGIDILFGQKEMDTVKKFMLKEEMHLVDSPEGIAKFTCRIPMEKVGVYHYAFRLYPKNSLLPHRQDFNLIKWL